MVDGLVRIRSVSCGSEHESAMQCSMMWFVQAISTSVFEQQSSTTAWAAVLDSNRG